MNPRIRTIGVNRSQPNAPPGASLVWLSSIVTSIGHACPSSVDLSRCHEKAIPGRCPYGIGLSGDLLHDCVAHAALVLYTATGICLAVPSPALTNIRHTTHRLIIQTLHDELAPVHARFTHV